ncbi:hypothetical protein HZS_5477 [Henneguya salminicola]|nr:hypothetical protein HZS_5477 [Henneguya salminicola]
MNLCLLELGSMFLKAQEHQHQPADQFLQYDREIFQFVVLLADQESYIRVPPFFIYFCSLFLFFY